MTRRSIGGLNGLQAVLLTVVMLAGCGLLGTPEAYEAAAPPYDSAPMIEEMEPSPEAPMRMADAGTQISATGDTAAALSMIAAAEASESRKVIKTAELALEVDSLDRAQAEILDVVDRRGGFIASLTVNDYATRREAKIVARVPSAHFREVYEAVKALGKVQRDHVGGQDVTEEFMDLERRIANLEAQEQRVRKMFEDAKTVEDLLKVEQRLTEVRGQIESLQGRLRYLKDQVGFSTLTLSLYEYGEAPVQETAGWKIAYHVKGAWRALVGAVQGLVTALIYLVIAGAVVWVPLVIVIVLIRNWMRRRRERRREQQTAASEAPAETPES